MKFLCLVMNKDPVKAWDWFEFSHDKHTYIILALSWELLKVVHHLFHFCFSGGIYFCSSILASLLWNLTWNFANRWRWTASSLWRMLETHIARIYCSYVLYVSCVFSVLKVWEWKKESEETDRVKTPSWTPSGPRNEKKLRTAERLQEVWLSDMVKRYSWIGVQFYWTVM